MSDGSVPPEFQRQVRDVLGHLFDSAYLQRHPLLAALVAPDIADSRARSQALREYVLRAVADLKPPQGTPPHDAAYRPYGILRHKYCEGLDNEDIQARLAIGRRQFFREQQRAIEAIAALLWERRVGESISDQSGQALADELDQLGLQSESFDLLQTGRQAVEAVRGLASGRGVALSVRADGPVQAHADEAISRQVLVGILSALVQQVAPPYLEVALEQEGRWVRAGFLGLPGALSRDQLETVLVTPLHLATRAGAQLAVEEDGHGLVVRLRLPSAREQVVAIVDDNPKTLALFQRYLQPYRYRVAAIQDSTRALADIRELRPDAVILDVMMRDVDGWQILQGLRTDPNTRAIPVIVCSVLNEEQLALTIGADGYLRKPVSPSDLVRALAQVRRGSGSEPAAPRSPSPASA